MGLTKKQLHVLTDKIQAERERIANAFSVDEEKFVVKTEEQKDEVDQASADYQKISNVTFLETEMFSMQKKLQKALDKIEAGEYGECEEAPVLILVERLMARPTAEMCISCKDELKEEQGNFIAEQSSH